ncbi:GGDEF and EAL domain-containing protein [Neptuniibacter sp.]|uniref:putative bifunctional diguanylate cyclase/phosphodiesterase n=1 Tax=Neptuniibacter sp. TaxID=1962643 RepID=UPI00261C4700|nr:GGDEF and EAL domain-containing protein [Neptuniibacter sp.]MCP4597008.1 EAL domain-containing protein [Neptuniibacter sp.]
MPDINKTQLQTISKPGNSAKGVVITGLLPVALVWTLDPLVHAIFFDHGHFLEELLSPSPQDLYFRILLTLIILTFSYFYRHQLNRYKKQNSRLEQQKQLIQKIIDSEPECVKRVARDGALLDMNPAGLSIIEADALKQVQYASVYDLIAEEDRDAYIAFNAKIFSGETASMEYDIVGLEGSRKRVDSHAVPLYDEEGGIVAHLAITRDITAFKKSQQELSKFSQAVEQCASMVMMTDTEGKITYVNPRFCSVTGYSEDECLGKTPRIIRSGLHPKELYEEMWQKISTGIEWRGILQNRRKDDELYWASVVISPVNDESGQLDHFLCTQEDITDSHQLNQQLEYQARHCMLTGLVNRHEFEQQLEQLLIEIRQNKSHHAIVFADIDQFKLINDTCGHAAGDQLLRQISSLLQANVRQNDLVSRLGGDEFAVLIRYCEIEKAGQVVEHLRQCVEDFTFLWENQSFKVTISLGWLALDEFSPDSTTILSQADASCYIAKEQGRNRLHFHRDNDKDHSRQGEFQWVNRIHEGLEKNQFQLYVQEIRALTDTEQNHYEVLLRYRDEANKLIPPGAFLPPAERYGISPKIDRWVVCQVCHLLTSDLADNITLSVNLSGLSINDPEFLKYVSQCLDKFQVPAHKLCFEITETATISNLTEAVKFISRMKEMGCLFSLDDFGSGLSSFGYLRTLPVDYVKIDGIFVKNICESEIDQAMVRSINEIGQLMGKETVAEFVENEEAITLLQEMGIDYAQGFAIAKPYPIEELIEKAR